MPQQTRKKNNDALEAAHAKLSAEGVKITERKLAEASGMSTGAVHNWMIARGQGLSAKAQAQLNIIKERHPIYGSNSGSKSKGASDSGPAPASDNPGIEYPAGDAHQSGGIPDRSVPGHSGDNGELHRGHERPRRANGQPDRGADKTPLRDERDGQGDLRSQGTIGDKVLRGAASFYEKTKENFNRQKDDKPPKKPGRVLSEREIDELREDYTNARRAMFDLADDVIKATTPGHKEPDIWKTIDDGELSVMVEAKLTRAKRSVRAANDVRRAIEIHQRIAETIIVAPRIVQTVQLYSDLGFEMPFKIRWTKAKKPPKMRVVDADKKESA